MTNNAKSGTYDRMKHKIVREEATAQATSELVADDVEMRLAALEKEDRINQLLAELKTKAWGVITGPSAGTALRMSQRAGVNHRGVVVLEPAETLE